MHIAVLRFMFLREDCVENRALIGIMNAVTNIAKNMMITM